MAMDLATFLSRIPPMGVTPTVSDRRNAQRFITNLTSPAATPTFRLIRGAPGPHSAAQSNQDTQ